MKEEKCIVLDFLATGYPDSRHSEPVAQAIGASYFSLLELVVREGVSLRSEEEVYIGEGKRDKIKFIKGSLEFDDLTNFSRSTLDSMIEKIVVQNEKKIVEFFNKSRMVTPRMHQIQLLPGVGKKHLIDLLQERNKKPFDSFRDINDRVKMFPDVVKTISRRVRDELAGDEKYNLFVYKPKKREF
ncbi:MAG: DUF655 domain-containing protein [Candidatus Aenigmarchaeota archaeon]|nr:DUF655 domain-containing protein [Candidatus Aenigmarchaeota archaeon]